MLKYFALFYAFWTVDFKGQVNQQFLQTAWTKVNIRMLDGSKDVSEPYINSKFDQWKFSGTKFCMDSNPILFNPNTCFDYKLENNLIRTSPQSGYEIEKLTADSLIVVEKLNGINTNDKIRKIWFVKSSKIKNDVIKKAKTDSVIIANENFTPTMNKNFIIEINEKFRNLNKAPNFNLIGNIVFYPKREKIELDIKNASEIQKFEKYVEIEKSIIENSFKNWNLNDFMNFEKVYLPFIIQSNAYNVDSQYTYRGSQIYYFTNDLADIPKINGVRAENVRESGKNFNDGILAFQNKKYEKAIQYFEKAYKLDGRNTDALYNIAAIYSIKNDSTGLCATLKILKDLEQTQGTNLYKQNCSK